MNQNLKEERNVQKIEKEINNRGITLIALVITIIVLLILAGVTINLTLGENGIFKTAEMAGKNYTQAQEQELAGIANFENEINNIIAGTGNNEGGDQEETNYSMLKDVAIPGAYVKYDTGIAGLGENKDGIVAFRVLYNDSTYGLQIISDRNVENVTLGVEGEDLAAWQASMESYNNAINILNQRAEYYAASSPYALDGRCVGSVPTISTDGKFNAKNTEQTGTYNIPEDWTLPSDWGESRDTGCAKLADTNYTSNGAEGVARDKETMEKINDMWTVGEIYWLASHNIASDPSSCYFNVRFVEANGVLGGCSLCGLNSGGYKHTASRSYGFRPVISLNPNVKVISGDGSEQIPYELAV